MSQRYMRILIFGMPGFALFQCGRRFMQAQGHFAAGLYALIILIPVQVLSTWLLVNHFHLGIVGIAIGLGITRTLLPVGLLIYSWLYKLGRCWRPLDAQIFRHWGIMIRLALPSWMMLEADILLFEIMTMLAGRFGVAEVGAQSLCVIVIAYIFMIPQSIGIAASTEIGSQLGKGDGAKAKEATKITMWLANATAWMMFGLLLIFHKQVPWLLTDEESVVILMQEIMPLIALFQFVDAYIAIMDGVLKGVGKQLFGAWATIVGSYVVGVPAAIIAAFQLKWRLRGLWAGLAFAQCTVVAAEGIYLWNLDWQQLVEDARERNFKEQNEVQHDEAESLLHDD